MVKKMSNRAKPRKMETVRTVAELEKQYRKTKQLVWKKLAESVGTARRRRVTINLWKLDRLAKSNSGKVLVVPGKVLGFGSLKEKANVIALEYSGSAMEKINAVGNASTLEDAIKGKVKPSTMVIVK